MTLTIVIEGVDGAGKTTLANEMKVEIERLDLTCSILHAPDVYEDLSGGIIYDKEGMPVFDPKNSHWDREAFYLAWTMRTHSEMMTPRNADILILDRYIYSQIAYSRIDHASNGSSDMTWLHLLNSLAEDVMAPDFTYLLTKPLDSESREKHFADELHSVVSRYAPRVIGIHRDDSIRSIVETSGLVRPFSCHSEVTALIKYGKERKKIG